MEALNPALAISWFQVGESGSGWRALWTLTSSKAVGVIFKKLATFSEYKITVTSYLDHFNQTQSSHQFGRTRKFTIEFITIFYELGQNIKYEIPQFRAGSSTGRYHWTASFG